MTRCPCGFGAYALQSSAVEQVLDILMDILYPNGYPVLENS